MGIFGDSGIIAVFSEFGWILIPIGLFLGLLGYRFYQLSLFLIIVLVGLGVGELMGSGTDYIKWYRIGGVVVGVFLGSMAHRLAKFSFFVIGMAGGFSVSQFIFEQTSLGLEGSGELTLKLITIFLGGVLTRIFYRSLIIVFISIVGIILIYQSTFHLFPLSSDNWSWILYAILLLVFIVIQFIIRASHEDPVEEAEIQAEEADREAARKADREAARKAGRWL